MKRFLIRAFLLLLAASSCFAADPDWVQVKSPNFTVLTDAGEKRGREVALHFEQMRAVFGVLFAKAKVTSPQPLLILAFRSTREMQSVSPLWKGKPVELAGYFQPADGITFIALDLSTEGKWETVFHEYAHNLLNANSLEAPLWFEEGFAEYYSTVKIANDSFEVGVLPEGAPYILANQKWMPLADLFSVDHASPAYNERDRQSVFYAESWLAMNYFWFDRARVPQTEKFITLLQNKTAVADAIHQAYGVEPKQLDSDLSAYYRTGRVLAYRYKVPDSARNLPLAAEPVAAIDARARIAELRVHITGRATQAMDDFQQILKEKTDQPVALQGLAYAALHDGDKQKASEYFRRAAALNVSDAHTYYFSALLSFQMADAPDEQRASEVQAYLQKALALDPNLEPAYNLLGITYGWQRKFDEAIQAEQRALQLDPRDERAALNLVSSFMGAQQVSKAIELAQQLTNSSEPAIAQAAVTILQRVQDYKEQMAQSAAARRELEVRVRQVDTATVGSSAASEASGPAAQAPDPSAPIAIAGTLSQVQCLSGGRVNFTVDTGTLSYVLISSDVHAVKFSGGSFSCGMKNQKVKALFTSGEKGNVPLEIDFQ